MAGTGAEGLEGAMSRVQRSMQTAVWFEDEFPLFLTSVYLEVIMNHSLSTTHGSHSSPSIRYTSLL